MPTKSALANKIETLRKERGWTKARLAEQSGVSERTVRRIETGETPSLDTLQALAAAFNIDCAELSQLTREEAKPRARKPVVLEIRDGHDLLTGLRGADAFGVDAHHTDDDETADLITTLLAVVEDADVYDELGASERYEQGRRLTGVIRQLHEKGWGLAVIREIKIVRASNGRVIPNWKTALLGVYNLGQRFEETLETELDKLAATVTDTKGENAPN